MFRFAKNAAAAVALTGLVLSQPALAVRSSESLPAPGAKISQVGRVGTPVKASEDVRGVPMFGWLLALLIAGGALAIILSDNHNHHKSPG